MQIGLVYNPNTGRYQSKPLSSTQISSAQSKGYNVGALGTAGASGNALSNSYNDAFNEAKAANEQRYQDILGGYDSRVAEAKTMGAQALKDISTYWRGESSKGIQDLTGRGLANTTVRPTMLQSYGRMEQADLGREKDRQTRQMLDFEKERLDFMERRTDAYPDMNQMIGLQQGAGEYGSAGYGGAFDSLLTSGGGKITQHVGNSSSLGNSPLSGGGGFNVASRGTSYTTKTATPYNPSYKDTSQKSAYQQMLDARQAKLAKQRAAISSARSRVSPDAWDGGATPGGSYNPKIWINPNAL